MLEEEIRVKEPLESSEAYRVVHYRQLESWLNLELEAAESKRTRYFQPDYKDTQTYIRSLTSYRDKLLDTVGYPPLLLQSANMHVREEFIGEDPYCRMSRLFIPVADGMECYGIFMTPKQGVAPFPLMMVIHGGGGAPELVCNLEKTSNYAEAGKKFIQEGYAVFAPLLIFKTEIESEIPNRVHYILDQKAKLIGTSLVAIQLWKLQQGLSYLLTKPEIDKNKVGVAGLSYGGFYSLLLAAIEPRIGWCISSCYLNQREAVNRNRPDEFMDWNWQGALLLFSDVEIIGLICPKTCIIEVGCQDDLFLIDGARIVAEQASKHYERLQLEDQFHYIEFEGGHEFNLKQAIEIMRDEWK
ncbi:alpha/beta hydrolase family protein [Paenibacillus psychroresistens]|nr:dienelactone hydrolase family protein [Paenibacillus psychroresistens]